MCGGCRLRLACCTWSVGLARLQVYGASTLSSLRKSVHEKTEIVYEDQLLVLEDGTPLEVPNDGITARGGLCRTLWPPEPV